MIADRWYTAVASSRLRARPIATRVGDLDLVALRDGDGRAHVLLDRCSHRGVPLSKGTVVPDGAGGRSITCRHHGWRYGPDGACLDVPSLRPGAPCPRGADVPRFDVVEADGWVWVWAPGVEEHPTGPPPAIPGFAERSWKQGSVPMACSYVSGIENNLDWCHAAFAHPWTHPQWYAAKLRGLREQAYELRTDPDGLVMFTPPTASPDDPTPAQAAVALTFSLPNRVIVKLGGPRGLVVVMHFVPTGPASCRLDWMRSAYLPARRRVAWSAHEPLVFKQDRRLLEGAQPWQDRDRAFERSVKADTSTLLARRIVALAEEGQWPQRSASLPARSVIEVRA